MKPTVMLTGRVFFFQDLGKLQFMEVNPLNFEEVWIRSASEVIKYDIVNRIIETVNHIYILDESVFNDDKQDRFHLEKCFCADSANIFN